MRNRRIMWKTLVVLLMAMTVVWLGACAAAPESNETEMETMVDGDALLQASCTKCHNLDRVKSKQWDRERWEQVVDGMIQKGAEVANKEALVDYLAETYGP